MDKPRAHPEAETEPNLKAARPTVVEKCQPVKCGAASPAAARYDFCDTS